MKKIWNFFSKSHWDTHYFSTHQILITTIVVIRILEPFFQHFRSIFSDFSIIPQNMKFLYFLDISSKNKILKNKKKSGFFFQKCQKKSKNFKIGENHENVWKTYIRSNILLRIFFSIFSKKIWRKKYSWQHISESKFYLFYRKSYRGRHSLLPL